ncbi:Uncharacterized protein GBIM_15972 [Gryllus bimaculatus]|nr:Uncharacterized protein GBIM_15972 [Gryllus bimaculatus]
MALSTTYVKDEQGATFIAASQRPDGTWRKPRRVKDGYVPQEEVPLYESKGKQFAKNKPTYPVGLSPEIIAASKARREKEAKSKSPIPGLIINAATETKTTKKKKKKKGASNASVEAVTETLAKTQVSTEEIKPSSKAAKVTTPVNSGLETNKKTSGGNGQSSSSLSCSDPAKRVKNLRKKLREIEVIEQKIKTGELKNPDKDQLEKVARKTDIQSEMDRLLPLLSNP